MGLEHEANLLDKPESPLPPSLNTKSKNIAEKCGVGEQEVPKDRGLQNRQNWSIKAAARVYHVFKCSVSRTVRRDILSCIGYTLVPYRLKADQNGKILLVLFWHSSMALRTWAYVGGITILSDVGH